MQKLSSILLIAGFLQRICADEWTTGENDDEAQSYCPITAESFAKTYSSMVEVMAIVDPQTGQSCAVPDEDYQYVQDGDFDDYEVCDTIFYFSQQLVLDLNATDECCLLNISTCHNGTDSTTVEKVDKIKAFGYGTLMVVVLSLLSFLGVLILPFLRENTVFGRYFQHFNLFMVSLGASALFSDAILHLLPQTFGLDHHHTTEQHSGGGAGGQAMVWKACAVVGGMYFFFFVEYLLHWLTGSQHHSHGNHEDVSLKTNDPSELLIKEKEKKLSTSCKGSESSPSYISKSPAYKRRGCCTMKPLAILVIGGDAIHNFTDGIALGASMSQSLALGVSTAVAITFHEIPHELGNFAILLSTGMRWPCVLLVSLFSSITAFIGFYLGVSVGMVSSAANSWMLAIAAGTFLYISLVDLLPLIMASQVRGCTAFLLINIGFFVSFNILLMVAIFEGKLDSLFTSHFS